MKNHLSITLGNQLCLRQSQNLKQVSHLPVTLHSSRVIFTSNARSVTTFLVSIIMKKKLSFFQKKINFFFRFEGRQELDKKTVAQRINRSQCYKTFYTCNLGISAISQSFCPWPVWPENCLKFPQFLEKGPKMSKCLH